MRLYIIRHADPDYPNNTITAAGHLEAQALAERMARQGLDRIYTSPVARARITAEYTARLMAMPLHVEDWTAELPWQMEYEDFGRISAWDLPGEVIRGGKKVPTHDNWHELPPIRQLELREKFDTVKHNSDEFLERHGYQREGGLLPARPPPPGAHRGVLPWRLRHRLDRAPAGNPADAGVGRLLAAAVVRDDHSVR